MCQIKQIIKEIREFASKPDWSKSRLAREAGLHVNTLRDLNDRDFNPTAETLNKTLAFISKQKIKEAKR